MEYWLMKCHLPDSAGDLLEVSVEVGLGDRVFSLPGRLMKSPSIFDVGHRTVGMILGEKGRSLTGPIGECPANV